MNFFEFLKKIRKERILKREQEKLVKINKEYRLYINRTLKKKLKKLADEIYEILDRKDEQNTNNGN